MILENSNKGSLVTVPSALLKSIVIDFMKSHPKDMELLKNETKANIKIQKQST